MQEYIRLGLGWLYELIAILGIGGFGALSIILIFRNIQLKEKLDRMKTKEALYKKELAQYKTVSEEFYEKVWAE